MRFKNLSFFILALCLLAVPVKSYAAEKSDEKATNCNKEKYDLSKASAAQKYAERKVSSSIAKRDRYLTRLPVKEAVYNMRVELTRTRILKLTAQVATDCPSNITEPCRLRNSLEKLKQTLVKLDAKIAKDRATIVNLNKEIDEKSPLIIPATEKATAAKTAYDNCVKALKEAEDKAEAEAAK